MSFFRSTNSSSTVFLKAKCSILCFLNPYKNHLTSLLPNSQPHLYFTFVCYLAFFTNNHNTFNLFCNYLYCSVLTVPWSSIPSSIKQKSSYIRVTIYPSQEKRKFPTYWP
jgi:hypothetical protein